jgi:hypothetical protein
MAIRRRHRPVEPIEHVDVPSPFRILRTPDEVDEAIDRAIEREQLNRRQLAERLGKYRRRHSQAEDSTWPGGDVDEP